MNDFIEFSREVIYMFTAMLIATSPALLLIYLTIFHFNILFVLILILTIPSVYISRMFIIKVV